MESTIPFTRLQPCVTQRGGRQPQHRQRQRVWRHDGRPGVPSCARSCVHGLAQRLGDSLGPVCSRNQSQLESRCIPRAGERTESMIGVFTMHCSQGRPRTSCRLVRRSPFAAKLQRHAAACVLMT